jgi:S1-C subfamily serine protease
MSAQSLAGLLILVPLLWPALAGAETAVPESPAQIALSFAPVVKETAPAVVNIYARQVVQDRANPFAGDPFFDQFFQDFGDTRPRVQNSLGSGVIVVAEGIVVSNHHVIADATDIRVVLADRREFAARVLLDDPQSDLAVLKVDTDTPLPALPIGDSEALQVGDLVLAIGNPFGVGQTVSSGIVSGLARSALQVGDGTGYFVQTDAPINPGNSGGALVDMAGRLVGINTAIVTRDGGSNGIGFAVPSDLVAVVVAQALAGETAFRRPWAGVSGQEVDGPARWPTGCARSPATLSEVIGQEKVLSPKARLGAMLAAGSLSSLILWGPPGVGKTTIARLLADETDLAFVQISAIFTGVPELRKVFEAAKMRRQQGRARCCSSTRSTASTRPSRTASCRTWRTAPSFWSAPRPRTPRSS